MTIRCHFPASSAGGLGAGRTRATTVSLALWLFLMSARAVKRCWPAEVVASVVVRRVVLDPAQHLLAVESGRACDPESPLGRAPRTSGRLPACHRAPLPHALRFHANSGHRALQGRERRSAPHPLRPESLLREWSHAAAARCDMPDRSKRHGHELRRSAGGSTANRRSGRADPTRKPCGRAAAPGDRPTAAG